MNKTLAKLAFAAMLLTLLWVALSHPVEKAPGRDYAMEDCIREVSPRIRATHEDWQKRAMDVCTVSRRIAAGR